MLITRNFLAILFKDGFTRSIAKLATVIELLVIITAEMSNLVDAWLIEGIIATIYTIVAKKNRM